MSDIDILDIGARIVADSSDVRIVFALRDGPVAHVTLTLEELVARAWIDPEPGDYPRRLMEPH